MVLKLSRMPFRPQRFQERPFTMRALQPSVWKMGFADSLRRTAIIRGLAKSRRKIRLCEKASKNLATKNHKRHIGKERRSERSNAILFRFCESCAFLWLDSLRQNFLFF